MTRRDHPEQLCQRYTSLEEILASNSTASTDASRAARCPGMHRRHVFTHTDDMPCAISARVVPCSTR